MSRSMIAQVKRPGLGNSPARDPTPELSAALHSCRTAFVGTGLFSGVINILMLTGALFVEAKVSPNDIDQLQIDGQMTRRPVFASQPSTSERRLRSTVPSVGLPPTLRWISARDKATIPLILLLAVKRLRDLASLSWCRGCRSKPSSRLHDRSVISYLAKPLSDQIARAFRDEQ